MVKKEKTLSFWHPAVLLGTWFGVGKIPFASGTWGSLATFPFFFLLVFLATLFIGVTSSLTYLFLIVLFFLLMVTAGLFYAGVWASNVYMEHTKTQDPSTIVIDEVVGQMITLMMVMPLMLLCAFPIDVEPRIVTGVCFPVLDVSDYVRVAYIPVLSFFAFRGFDIIKPFPANWIDKNLKGGYGVMLDDVVAAVYAGISVYVFTALKYFVQPILLG